MSLKHIVPTLGLVAALTPAAMAADVGGLTINGYVDTILEIQSYDEAIAFDSPNEPGVDSDDDTEIDFTASAQTEIGYKIGANVSANIELFYGDEGAGAGRGTLDGHTLHVEQAYVEWAVNDQVSLAMGEFHNHLGWEGNDAPELYRVNWSQVWSLQNGLILNGALAAAGADADTSGNTTGLGVGIAASEQVDIGIYLVDGFWGEDGVTGRKELADLALGANVTFTVKGLGLFDIDLAYDMNASTDDSGEEADIFALGFNGEIDALRESNGVLFFWDLFYIDYDLAAGLGFLAGGNLDLKTDTPMSLTANIAYVDPVDDDDVAEDDDLIEIAIALLTNPTKDENFALNFEGRYIDRAADDSSEFGLFVEALAVIP